MAVREMVVQVHGGMGFMGQGRAVTARPCGYRDLRRHNGIRQWIGGAQMMEAARQRTVCWMKSKPMPKGRASVPEYGGALWQASETLREATDCLNGNRTWTRASAVRWPYCGRLRGCLGAPAPQGRFGDKAARVNSGGVFYILRFAGQNTRSAGPCQAGEADLFALSLTTGA